MDKSFWNKEFQNIGPIGPFDHDVYARIGEDLLNVMADNVSRTKKTLEALADEIVEYEAEWHRECKENNVSLGEIISTAYLREMSQLNAEMNLAYKICESWRDKKYGIIP